jgi:hypothetical protein
LGSKEEEDQAANNSSNRGFPTGIGECLVAVVFCVYILSLLVSFVSFETIEEDGFRSRKSARKTSDFCFWSFSLEEVSRISRIEIWTIGIFQKKKRGLDMMIRTSAESQGKKLSSGMCILV